MNTATSSQNFTPENAICLVLQFRAWGNRSKIPTEKMRVEADPGFITGRKKLISSPEFDAIRAHKMETLNWVYRRTLPSILKRGCHLIPTGLVTEVENYLLAQETQYATLLDQFVEAYPEQARQAEEFLGEVYNPQDYPTTMELRGKFGMTWTYITYGTSAGLEEIDAGIFQRAQQKYASMWEQTLDSARSVLYDEMAALTDRMVKALAPGEDGKRRKFTSTLTGNVEEFLRYFEARNITNDEQLRAIAEQMRQATQGVTVETLRGDNEVRAVVAEAFTTIKETLDSYVVATSRSYNFDEE